MEALAAAFPAPFRGSFRRGDGAFSALERGARRLDFGARRRGFRAQPRASPRRSVRAFARVLGPCVEVSTR